MGLVILDGWDTYRAMTSHQLMFLHMIFNSFLDSAVKLSACMHTNIIIIV